MKRFIFSVVLCLSVIYAQAQVGINQPSPHSSAALEINGGGTKGLLVPFMNQSQRNEITGSANGLLVYDPVEKMFYYYNGSEWVAQNPLQAKDGSTSTVVLTNGSTIIFDNDMVANKTFTVNGNTTLQNPVVINNTLTANGNINAGSNTISSGTIVSNTVNVGTQTVITTDKVKTTTLEGYGVTPLGGIIMWSGVKTSVPDGWALCDGKEVNGYTTPDLRGRFVVGYGENGTDPPYMPSNVWDQQYEQPGNLSIKGNVRSNYGGEMRHTLTTPELPSHSHSIANITRTSGGGTKIGDTDWHENRKGTEINSGGAGENKPHENRPPYYVLAFIMRVK